MSKKVTYLRVVSVIALVIFGLLTALKITHFDTYHLFLGNLVLFYNLIFVVFSLFALLGKKIHLIFLIAMGLMSFTIGGFVFFILCAIPAYFINKTNAKNQLKI